MKCLINSAIDLTVQTSWSAANCVIMTGASATSLHRKQRCFQSRYVRKKKWERLLKAGVVLLNVAQQDSAATSSFNRVTSHLGIFLNVAQQFFVLFFVQTRQKEARAPACQPFRERNKNTLINSINQHVEGRLIGGSACAKKLMELRWVKITIISRGDRKNIVAKTGSNQAYNNWHVKPR